MPEGPDGKTIIIVKKVSGGGGHHGGAWKVAYADFVTAMMALFMVLWLVNSAAEPTRQRIASYFRKPGVFQKGSGTPLETGGGGILPDTFAPPADANSQIQASDRIYEIEAVSGKVREYFDPAEGESNKRNAGVDTAGEAEGQQKLAEERLLLQELAEQIEQMLSEGGTEDSGLLGDVDVKVDQRGLLIEIMDTENASMFRLGSAEIVPEAREQLRRIADVLVVLPNPLDIEGHTDGRPFRGPRAGSYDNWNLASDRAHSARRVLEAAGIQKSQIARVVGYADQRPKVPGDLLNHSNRRITISMRFTEQAQAALHGTQTAETRPQRITLPGSGRQAPQDARPEAAPSQTQARTEAETPSGELRVEVGTTLPEGSTFRGSQEPALRPQRIEKDKIFGPSNPFFD